ncbi:MAG: MrpF/PhaF family protein [Nitrospinae bacterium]|nr:MrpF/PhaF family protein [Nitrospinota bacterium]
MAVNVIGIKAVAVFVLLGVVLHESFYFDVAMAYIVLLYIATLALMKYLDSGRLD